MDIVSIVSNCMTSTWEWNVFCSLTQEFRGIDALHYFLEALNHFIDINNNIAIKISLLSYEIYLNKCYC